MDDICKEYGKLYSSYYTNQDINLDSCTDNINNLVNTYNANREDMDLQDEEKLLNNVTKIYNRQLTDGSNSNNYLLKQELM